MGTSGRLKLRRGYGTPDGGALYSTYSGLHDLPRYRYLRARFLVIWTRPVLTARAPSVNNAGYLRWLGGDVTSRADCMERKRSRTGSAHRGGRVLLMQVYTYTSINHECTEVWGTQYVRETCVHNFSGPTCVYVLYVEYSGAAVSDRTFLH